AEGLAAAARQLEPAEAARVCAGPARLLSEALTREKDPGSRASLAEGLAAVAGRLEAIEAAQLLTQVLTHEKHAAALGPVSRGLATVAQRLPPAEATRICAEAARLLARALAWEEDRPNCKWL